MSNSELQEVLLNPTRAMAKSTVPKEDKATSTSAIGDISRSAYIITRRRNTGTSTDPFTSTSSSQTDSAYTRQRNINDASTSTNRMCWICFETDEDNSSEVWVSPCRCRGSTKWVHQSCLCRWVDEKQRGNPRQAVSCPQCRTGYVIVYPYMGVLVHLMEAFDSLIRRVSPYIAAFLFAVILYWMALTFGALTFFQILGIQGGVELINSRNPLTFLIMLPIIPVVLIMAHIVRWPDLIVRLIGNRRDLVRKIPLMSPIMDYLEEEVERNAQNVGAARVFSDQETAVRTICRSMIFPGIAHLIGHFLFGYIQCRMYRTMFGGLLFITVKSMLTIYYKVKQCNRKKKRYIVDYPCHNSATNVREN